MFDGSVLDCRRLDGKRWKSSQITARCRSDGCLASCGFLFGHGGGHRKRKQPVLQFAPISICVALSLLVPLVCVLACTTEGPRATHNRTPTLNHAHTTQTPHSFPRVKPVAQDRIHQEVVTWTLQTTPVPIITASPSTMGSMASSTNPCGDLPFFEN
jgi:hypothetical protein